MSAQPDVLENATDASSFGQRIQQSMDAGASVETAAHRHAGAASDWTADQDAEPIDWEDVFAEWRSVVSEPPMDPEPSEPEPAPDENEAAPSSDVVAPIVWTSDQAAVLDAAPRADVPYAPANLHEAKDPAEALVVHADRIQRLDRLRWRVRELRRRMPDRPEVEEITPPARRPSDEAKAEPEAPDDEIVEIPKPPKPEPTPKAAPAPPMRRHVVYSRRLTAPKPPRPRPARRPPAPGTARVVT
jgi:hypothetical protein